MGYTARVLFLAREIDGSVTHPAFHSVGSRALSHGVKQQGHDADHPHAVPRPKMMKLYLHNTIHFHGKVLN
jgi:hypothetical protein